MKGEKVNMKEILIWIFVLVLSLILNSCAPLVKTDLQSLKDNPEKYQGKIVIITTDIKSVFEAPEAYLGKKIELKGYVEYKGFRELRNWNFILKDKEGRSIRCYEREYRVEAWIIPVMAIRKAARNNQQLTVVGKLQKGLKIELDWIEYEGLTIDTDFKPFRVKIG
ncbi:MAG: hypothetical protein DRG25_03570 [Deltaproteobacteria bacterium]|nr:MAG: hypothetical protein DRG25_03570 [Deltaproteobacteria bacterium]